MKKNPAKTSVTCRHCGHETFLSQRVVHFDHGQNCFYAYCQGCRGRIIMAEKELPFALRNGAKKRSMAAALR